MHTYICSVYPAAGHINACTIYNNKKGKIILREKNYCQTQTAVQGAFINFNNLKYINKYTYNFKYSYIFIMCIYYMV